MSRRDLDPSPESKHRIAPHGRALKTGDQARAVLEALSSLAARLRTSDRQASAQPRRRQLRAWRSALPYLDCLFATRAIIWRRGASPCVSPSSCVSPQEHKTAIHHRARSVDSANRRAARKLARLQNQPVNIVTRNEAARGDRQDFGAARRTPRLNLSNLVSVQQHPVATAPSPKRSDPSTRLDSQPRPYCLLYSHSGITFEFIFLLRGCPKIYENR